MNTKVELEDFHEDILGKAMRGLGLGKNEMANRLGVEKSKIDSILSGEANENLIRLMADEVNLDANKLIISARKEWSPTPVEIKGVRQFNLPFGDMRVNAYVVWDEIARKSWVFDTGPKEESIISFLENENLEVDAIFLTHTHGDHIACLDKLKQKTDCTSVFVHKLESLEGVESIEEGFEHVLGNLTLKALHTHGHSAGGVSYLIDGLEKPVAVVGDALFAGSMGGGMVSYADALKNNREKLMTLPDETIVCPGHGPMTTIGEEKRANPFFPEFPVAI